MDIQNRKKNGTTLYMYTLIVLLGLFFLGLRNIVHGMKHNYLHPCK